MDSPTPVTPKGGVAGASTSGVPFVSSDGIHLSGPSPLAVECLNPAEIARAASLFDGLKQLRLRLRSGEEAVLEKAFEMHVQAVLSKLDTRLSMDLVRHHPRMQQVETILARHGLFDSAFQQVILLCHSIAPALGESVKELRNIHSGFLTDIQGVVAQYIDDVNHLAAERNAESERANRLDGEVLRLQEGIIRLNEEAEEQNRKIMELRSQLRVATIEVQNLREISSGNTNSKNLAVLPSFDTSVAFGEGFTSVSSPKGVQRSRTNSSGGANGGNLNSSSSVTSTLESPRFMNSKHSNRLRNSQSVFQFPEESSSPVDDFGGVMSPRSTTGTQVTNNSAGNQSTVGRKILSKAPMNAAWIHGFRKDVQKAIDEGRCRMMSLKETRDLMERMYDSKTQANERALAGGSGSIPMETLEQHIYRMMEKKYGLRSLAVEHAGMFLSSVDHFAPDDNDINVFAHSFRNEVEEDFRFVQFELAKSIRDLTMVSLMGRHPSKDQNTIASMLQHKIAAGIITEDEWRDMINYLYNENDAATVALLLRRRALLERDESPSISATSIQPNGIPSNSTSTQILHSSSLGTPGTVARPGTTYIVAPTPESAPAQGYDKSNPKDIRRLGYASQTLRITVKEPAPEVRRGDVLTLPFGVFLKSVLDFQLESHKEYLSSFVNLFRQVDHDVDGVLTAAEFQEFFHMLRQSSEDAAVVRGGNPTTLNQEEELKTLFALLKILDPHETDRIVFSNAVICLQKVQQVTQ